MTGSHAVVMKIDSTRQVPTVVIVKFANCSKLRILYQSLHLFQAYLPWILCRYLVNNDFRTSQKSDEKYLWNTIFNVNFYSYRYVDGDVCIHRLPNKQDLAKANWRLHILRLHRHETKRVASRLYVGLTNRHMVEQLPSVTSDAYM